MAIATLDVIDAERVPDAEAKKIPASQIGRTPPPGPIDGNEVEGQVPYWQYYRCGCGSVFRVLLDTDRQKYFNCACGRYLYRA